MVSSIYTKRRDGAPVELVFPPEGAPLVPYSSGIPKGAAHPNAARLYLDFCLSREGQAVHHGGARQLDLAEIAAAGHAGVRRDVLAGLVAEAG